MSLINQVLKDLDKRGAGNNIGESTIRVVHGRSVRSAFWLIVAGAAGMLLVGGAGWMVWHAQNPLPPQPLPPPAVVVESVPAVEVFAASQVAVELVQGLQPQIDSVTPEAILTEGVAQIITIHGRYFSEGASVNLLEEGGRLYAHRPLLKLTPEEIELKLNFGKTTKAWMLEVLNADGTASGRYVFSVHAGQAPNSVRSRVSLAAETANNAGIEAATVKGNSETMLMSQGISKQPTTLSVQQQADNEYRRALQLLDGGRSSEALDGFKNVLQLDAGHEQARQSMVGLLLESKRNAEAIKVLQEGLAINSRQISFAMLLARLQVERNELALATETMLNTLPYAAKQADYHALLAAILQRQSRHKEAIVHFQDALKLSPQSGVWLMGLGISLHAEQRNAEAREMFNLAIASNKLSPELKSFVAQQLKDL